MSTAAPTTVSSGVVGYRRETFAPWAHPWDDKIDASLVHGKYFVFIPNTVYKRGAVGFRDLTQAADLSSMATGYCTVLQLLGAALKYLPYKGTRADPMRPNMYYTHAGGGDPITVPKARILLSYVAHDTHRTFDISPDLLPDHELFNPYNQGLFCQKISGIRVIVCQAGILVTIIMHDPELHLVDLLEAVVSDNVRELNAEERVGLTDELRDIAPPDMPDVPMAGDDGDEATSGTDVGGGDVDSDQHGHKKKKGEKKKKETNAKVSFLKRHPTSD
jgi:hypothetical protein